MKYNMRNVFMAVLLCVVSISIHGDDAPPWHLTATQTQVYAGKAENVTLTCRYDDDDDDNKNSYTDDTDNDNDEDTTQPRMKKVTRLSILKFNLDSNKPWRTYAKVDETNRPAVLVHPGGDRVTAYGLAGQVAQSYLSVTWEMTSQDTVGTYMCQVEGYTVRIPQAMFSTPVVTVEMAPLDGKAATDLFFENERRAKDLQKQSGVLLKHADTLQTKSDTEQRKAKAMRSKSVSLLKSFAKSVGVKIEAWPTTTTPANGTTQQATKRPTQPSPESHTQPATQVATQPTTEAPKKSLTQWPQGKFGLLKPDTGCPTSENGEKWVDGYVRFHTESSGEKYPNDDSVSDISHMAKPYSVRDVERGENLFFMRTCRQDNDRYLSAPKWPKGSYCVFDARGSMPDFGGGYVHIDTENDGPDLNMNFNEPSVVSLYFGVYVYFHCREDADPTVTIGLPVEKPFYLFRKGGKCQEVLNATVTEESFTLDSDDDTDNNLIDTDMVPDVTLEPLSFFTCFYQPIVY